MSTPVIDWIVAEWLARRIAGSGEGEPRGAAAAAARAAIDLPALTEDAVHRVVAYTGLTPREPIPRPEGVDRHQWVAANIASMRTMLDPLLEQAAAKVGQDKGAARLWIALLSSTEIGVAVGYLAQHVLGQYELMLLAERSADERPRLLFVVPNLERAVRQFNADPREFLTWVTLHEVTHAVQFGSVPWLREYVGSLIRELMAGAERRLEQRLRLRMRLPRRSELARVGRAALHADLIGMFANEQERAIIDRAQAVMAVIEGHAEHVMDAVAPELLPTLPHLRAAMDERRRSQRGISKLISKLLGLDMKLRQYAQGKAFCDAVAADGGPNALRHLFSDAAALPTLAELEAPSLWLARNRKRL